MYRATTPVHMFTLPIAVSSCDIIRVTYEQEGKKLKKTYKDSTADSGMTIEDNVVTIILTQQEANMFKKGNVNVQLRALSSSGMVYASKEFDVRVRDVLDDEILEVDESEIPR